LLDKAVVSSDTENPVLFDENLHVEKPFENSMQKFRFFDSLQLSVPVDVIRFCPGGGIGTTYILSQVPENRSDSEMMTDAARLVQRMRPFLKEFHTRAQKMNCKRKISNIEKIKPAIIDYMYSELALDAAAMSHPDTQQRLHLMSLGECGLVNDLRHLNPGCPNNKYDVFFEKLCEQVQHIEAADERRHGSGVAHMSRWISLSDMIAETATSCPEGTPIPSKSLVRLQFTPRNPYSSTALTFTSRKPIQYKIQRRQLRAQHPDDHYCAALFKYLKCRSIELKDDCLFFCVDDKAKVPVGEPHRPISTGVRGRQSIAPIDAELSSLDHDMKATSLTPSVALLCSIPDSVQQSFVRGQVTAFVNDSVTQSASPIRHAMNIRKIVQRNQANPKVLLKYTDGGTDQRNTLEQVKSANICLFRELDLDMLITVRCAPGQSYVNPAERIMSILNYGLQNVATERERQDNETELKLKRCNSVASIRELLRKHPELLPKWKDSIEPVQALIENRFRKLKLKEEPIQCMTPPTDDDLDLLKRHLRELFPELDLERLQKANTNKCAAYLEWKEKHCRETNYTFQIKKCNDASCCAPKQMEEEKLKWLPEPELDDTREHFLPYKQATNQETTEKDIPSLTDKKVCKKNTVKPRPGSSVEIHGEIEEDEERETSGQPQVNDTSIESVADVPLSSQNARAVAICVECRKPRVVYSKTKLNQRKEVALAMFLREYEFSCGAHLFPPSAALSEMKKIVVTRPFVQCATPVELCYYGAELGRKDLCAHCGDPGAETDAELKTLYKTVLPICQKC